MAVHTVERGLETMSDGAHCREEAATMGDGAYCREGARVLKREEAVGLIESGVWRGVRNGHCTVLGVHVQRSFGASVRPVDSVQACCDIRTVYT